MTLVVRSCLLSSYSLVNIERTAASTIDINYISVHRIHTFLNKEIKTFLNLYKCLSFNKLQAPHLDIGWSLSRIKNERSIKDVSRFSVGVRYWLQYTSVHSFSRYFVGIYNFFMTGNTLILAGLYEEISASIQQSLSMPWPVRDQRDNAASFKIWSASGLLLTILITNNSYNSGS